MPAIFVLVFFGSLVRAQETLADTSHGYLMLTFLDISRCTADPTPECSFSYKVVDRSVTQQSGQGPTSSSFHFKNLSMMVSGRTRTDKRCVKTIQYYLCKRNFSLICMNDYVTQDVDGVKESCIKAEKYCKKSALSYLVNDMLNCSAPLPVVAPKLRISRPKCVWFPEVENNQLSCEKRNYKVRFII